MGSVIRSLPKRRSIKKTEARAKEIGSKEVSRRL